MSIRGNNTLRRSLMRGLATGGLGFAIAVIVSVPSQGVIPRVSLSLAFPILLGIIMVGVVFDMIGVAAAAAEEAPFHAMAAKRIAGARQAIQLVRRADRVSSLANDIVGDIAASVSGAAGAAIVFRLVSGYGFPEDLTGTLVLGLIAALTVGGKAAMKGVAIRRANAIIMGLGRVIYLFERLTGLKVIAPARGTPGGSRRRPKR